MKNTLLILLAGSLIVVAGCHKKTIPTKTEPEVTEVPASAPPPTAALIVIDGYGKVLTPKDQLPHEAGLNPNYGLIARSFTPKEIANLKARYKTVPPKVLYVPDSYTKKTSRGTYAVYKKKFWYWKKEDGLFHLDKTYYE